MCRFQAFLLYLYTGEIEFVPAKSRGNLSRKTGPPGPSHHDIPRPSPRSMYRLADKVRRPLIISLTVLPTHLNQYDVPALKDLSLRRILVELRNRDIVEETFSKFASK